MIVPVPAADGVNVVLTVAEPVREIVEDANVPVSVEVSVTVSLGGHVPPTGVNLIVTGRPTAPELPESVVV